MSLPLQYSGWFQQGEGLLLPSGWGKLTAFQRLLVVKAIRSDLLVQGTNMFVKGKKGDETVVLNRRLISFDVLPVLPRLPLLPVRSLLPFLPLLPLLSIFSRYSLDILSVFSRYSLGILSVFSRYSLPSLPFFSLSHSHVGGQVRGSTGVEFARGLGRQQQRYSLDLRVEQWG